MPQSAGELSSETEPNGARIGLELGFLAHDVVDHLCRKESRFENPRDAGDQRDHGSSQQAENPRLASQVDLGARCKMLEDKTDARACNDGETQPLSDRQGNGVCTEMVAHLVGHDTSKFVFGEIGERVGTDHQDVPATGKCVDVVAVVDCEHESFVRYAGGPRNRPHHGFEFAQLARSGETYAEHACDEEALRERKEHDNRSESRNQDKGGIANRCERRQAQEDEESGDDPSGQEDEHRNRSGEG